VAQKFFKVSSMEPVQFNCMIQLYRSIHVFLVFTEPLGNFSITNAHANKLWMWTIY